ncbi:MAG: hypothetical protein JNK23_08585 [Opitutaceae bacterium]|nr:hypothetical protein [Opitutaceae bacterium]
MSLYGAVQAAYGGRVKRAGMMRRKKSFTAARPLRDFLNAYADETTKPNYVAPETLPVRTEEEYLRAILTGQAPLRPEIDYLPFHGRVTAFGGAARPEIYQTHEIEKLPPSDRLARLRQWWLRDTADLATKAHHVVFTLDPRLAAAMRQAGVSADTFLLTAVSNAFTEFQAQFYPGDTLGYVVALHHDRAHIHAHVLLHPLTESGARVNLGILRRYRVGDRTVDVPCQQVLKDSFERQAELACERLLPKPRAVHSAQREQRIEAAEELMLLHRATLEPDARAGGAIQIEKLVKIIDDMRGDPAALTLIRQGRDGVAHLIAEDLADGRLYEIQHNFPAIADKSSAARFEVTAQARTTLGMFSAIVGRASTLYIAGLDKVKLAAPGTPATTTGPVSFHEEVRARARHHRDRADENARLTHETAILRAKILQEDKTEAECLIASGHTALRMMQALSPALGDGPDLLTLWQPSAAREPRIGGALVRAASLNRELTRSADNLARRHQPVDLAQHAAKPSSSGETSDPETVETASLQTLTAAPGFLAHPQSVRLEDLLTLTPLEKLGGAEPTPGSF